MKTLMVISRFYIQISTVFITNFKTKKCNGFFVWFICKFYVSMELVKATQKGFKFLLAMCPGKKYCQFI